MRPEKSLTTEENEDFVCRWVGCDINFTSLDELVGHLTSTHVTPQTGAFYCFWRGCPRTKGFNARYKMLIHIRTHTNERPFLCQQCNKKFSRQENLRIHSRTHTGEKPYLCTVAGCGKAYSNSSDRFKHTRTHFVDKPYECKFPGCDKKYTDPSSLRKHVKIYSHAKKPAENHSQFLDLPKIGIIPGNFLDTTKNSAVSINLLESFGSNSRNINYESGRDFNDHVLNSDRERSPLHENEPSERHIEITNELKNTSYQHQNVSLISCRSQNISEISCRSQIISEIPCPSKIISEIPCRSQHISEIPCRSQNISEISCRSQNISEISCRSQNISEMTPRNREKTPHNVMNNLYLNNLSNSLLNQIYTFNNPNSFKNVELFNKINLFPKDAKCTAQNQKLVPTTSDAMFKSSELTNSAWILALEQYRSSLENRTFENGNTLDSRTQPNEDQNKELEDMGSVDTMPLDLSIANKK